MTAFTTALATLHADPNLGEAASFRRPPYVWQSCSIIRVRPNDPMGGLATPGARAGAIHVDVLAAEISERPRKGDEVRIGTTVYRVDDCEPDELGLSYRLTLGA